MKLLIGKNTYIAMENIHGPDYMNRNFMIYETESKQPKAGRYQPNSGKKVTILDTDHLWGCGGNYQWVWKSFLQGYNTIFMDPWQSFPHAEQRAMLRRAFRAPGLVDST